MPITDRGKAKEAGFAQVREALQSFEGDVVSAEFGQWGGKLVDDDGNIVPPKEFLEVDCVNVKPLTVTEELSMDISERFTFRVNCSDYKGSFWVEDFLASADKHKLLIPDDLTGKRIIWTKAVREYNIRGKVVSTSNFIIAGVKATGVPEVLPKAARVQQAVKAKEVYPTEDVDVTAGRPEVEDPMALALELAVGKTETQFRSAVSLHPSFVSSPLLPLAKAGAITATLVKEGKLVEVQEGTKVVYREPE